jgi:hypothetical protein
MVDHHGSNLYKPPDDRVYGLVQGSQNDIQYCFAKWIQNHRENLNLANLERISLRRFGKQMIRKRRRFWQCISKGRGEKGWKGRLDTFVLGGGWQIQTSEVLANLRIGAPSILDF